MHGYYILNPFACRYVSDYRCLVSSSSCVSFFYGETQESREWHESVKKLEELFKSLLIVAERMIESFSNYQTTLLFNMRAKNHIPLLLVAQCFKSKIQGVPTSIRKDSKQFVGIPCRMQIFKIAKNHRCHKRKQYNRKSSKKRIHSIFCHLATGKKEGICTRF